MSKGSKRRPIYIPRKDFDKKWDQIFLPKANTNSTQEKDSETVTGPSKAL